MNDLNLIVGPKGFRHVGEINQFLDLQHFKSTLLISEGYLPFNRKINSHSVLTKKLLPDFLAQLIVRKPFGPVSFLDFGRLDGIPEGGIINGIELYSFASKSCANVARKKKAKLCISSWETIPKNPLFFVPPYIFNVITSIKQTDLFLVPTRLAQDCLLGLGINRSKVKAIYPGIDLQLFSPAKHNHQGFRLLFIGRLDEEKGVIDLLKAFIMLNVHHKEVELWICGPIRSGHLFASRLRKLAQKYRIKLLGEVPRQEIPSIFAQSDALCLSSFDRQKWGLNIWEEQFGWSLVEALASGLPVIATDCGAIREVVGDHNLIVNQHSVRELYLAMSRLTKDKELQGHIGMLNRKRAEKLFDLRLQRKKLDCALVNLIE